MNADRITIQALVDERNKSKYLFTAGPASLLAENITGLRPCFGRGDDDYEQIEFQVLEKLKSMSGHQHIARLQGSATLALEIVATNFLNGRVLIVSSGYYSDRLLWLAQSAQRHSGAVTSITCTPWDAIEFVAGQFDWIVSCYTETSCALKLPVLLLSALAKRTGARLMLDATASIGLESGHEAADVIAYSSCKGLFGLTGAAFIAFQELPRTKPDSIYLDLATHLEKRVTGPYHAIASLANVLPRHADFRASVIENKRVFATKMAGYLTTPDEMEPLLCTHVNGEITASDSRAILYKPRGKLTGSVVCHLGEAHLGSQARGEIINALTLTTP